MIKATGAEITIRMLERQGIETIAGIPGGANLPLYDALSRSKSIRHVLARHEQGAGFMAQGMARSTGKAAVFFATSGPGATNTLTAIADAKLDSVPIICVTGQVPSPLIGTDAFQEVDIYGMSIPATKHNFLIHSFDELMEAIPAAFRIATSGRPGPVLIDIPRDIQVTEYEFEQWPEIGQAQPLPSIEQGSLEEAARLINESRRPILYLGGGVVHAGGGEAALALAEKGSIPAVMTLMGLGAIPAEHPKSLGMLGMHAAPCANLALEECDLLIAAGVRFDDRATGKVERFCPDARIVHIDIDPSELGKIRNPCVGVVGDVREAFERLLALIGTNGRAEWSIRVNELKRTYCLRASGIEDPRTPYGLIAHAARIAGPDAIVSTDVGQHQMRTAQVYPFSRERQWLTSGGLGTMGFGVPAAIGAAFANPERTVICFSGDGSILMNIQELATAVEENVNLKILLMNNNALGLVCQQQDLFFNKNNFASRYKTQTDFVRIARGFGMPALDLDEAADPIAALERIMSQPGPCLVHIPVREFEHVLPMVPPGAANKEMIGGEANA